MNRLAAFEQARPDFWTAQILQDRDVFAGPGSGLPHLVKTCSVLRLGAMRKIESEDVGAGGDQRIDDVRLGRNGAEGGNNLGMPHRLIVC